MKEKKDTISERKLDEGYKKTKGKDLSQDPL
jgi:hypothetical protein